MAAELEAQVPAGANGVAHLLVDTQVRVTAGSQAHFSHYTQRIASEAGLGEASQLELEVNPAFQRLVIHWVRRIRNGQVADALSAAEIKEVQRERGLEARLFDGTQTLLILLHDARVGDVIDYAYSLEGQNPVFEGRYAGGLSVGFSVPVHRLRHRLLWPSGRVLKIKTHGPPLEAVRTDRGAETEWRWALDSVPALEVEDALPARLEPYPWVQYSEWDSWAEVAKWAVRQFTPPRPAGPAVKRKAAELARDHAGEADRFLAALRFVQDDIRYFGFLMGPNSHRPHPPEAVLAQRLGDCKGKSLLLATLLAELKIEARPALVSSSGGVAIEGWLPTPFAFDHVITRATVFGDHFWVDPTSAYERGRLSQRTPPDLGPALVVSPDTTGLVTIPRSQPEEPLVDVEEQFTSPDRASPVSLEVNTRYRGDEANRIRRYLASSALSEWAKHALNFYAREDTGIRAVGEVKVEDDDAQNVITVTERYQIDDFWKKGERHFKAWPIAERLSVPRISQRTMPLGISHPVDVRYRLRLTLPEAIPVRPEADQLRGKAFRFESNLRAKGKLLMLDYRYRSLTDELPAADVTEHLANQKKLDDWLGYNVRLGSTSQTPAGGSRSAALWAVGYVGGLLLMIGGVLLVALRKPSRRRANPHHRAQGMAGTTPEVAVTLSHPSGAGGWLGGYRCRCGAQWSASIPHRWRQALTLGGRVITPLSVTCPQCEEEAWLYFHLPPPVVDAERIG